MPTIGPAERSALAALAAHSRWAEQETDLSRRAYHLNTAEEIRDRIQRQRARAAITAAIEVLDARDLADVGYGGGLDPSAA